MESTQEARTGLSSLAPEIILLIANLVEPPSQVALACTSRYFSECCAHQFRRHQAAHKKYRVSSDLDPETVPHLVRSALGFDDPLDAWHVRSLELWGSRRSWNEWRPFNLESSTPYTLQDRAPLQWSFTDRETEALMGLFSEMCDDERDSARGELHDGADRFLKVALITLLPRLVDVKIVSGASEESLSWFSHALQWGKQRASWPLGFAGLRELAVGMPSGTWRDGCRERLSAFTLASVLQLPRLESLYFSGLQVDEDDDDDEAVNWGDDLAHVAQLMPPANSIPLKRLVLDHVDNIESDFQSAILAAPRALEALSIRPIRNPRPGDPRIVEEGETPPVDERTFGDSDMVASDLAKFQCKSLRRLIFYHPERLDGYRCCAFYPEELDPCRNLRQVCVAVGDVELQAMSTAHRAPGRNNFIRKFLKAFPKALEVLVLHGEAGIHIEGDGAYGETLDDAVAKLLSAPQYPFLKAIFLEQVETARPKQPEYVLFPKSMAEGGKRGVDVYTRTSRAEKRHEIDMLTPPGRYDLLSGPYGRKGKEGLVLDVHSGEWGPPGCNACGRCEQCFKVYSPGLWSTIRSEGE